MPMFLRTILYFLKTRIGTEVDARVPVLQGDITGK
jgi:hypothetical protein